MECPSLHRAEASVECPSIHLAEAWWGTSADQVAWAADAAGAAGAAEAAEAGKLDSLPYYCTRSTLACR